jgi:hypothetical protein
MILSPTKPWFLGWMYFLGILGEGIKVSQNWFEEKAHVQLTLWKTTMSNMSIVIFQIIEWQKPESNPMKVLSYSHIGGVDCFSQKSVVPPVGCVKELARERLKNPSLTRHSPFSALGLQMIVSDSFVEFRCAMTTPNDQSFSGW